ncbi:MAG: histidinol-phosphate transaminase [Motiliproteus sp.]
MGNLLQSTLTPRRVIDLSANENPLGPSPMAISALQQALVGLHRYPSRDGSRLRQLLASELKITTDYLLLGNGASELLDITARALLVPGEQALIPVPSFMPYRKVVIRSGAKAVTVPTNAGQLDLAAMLAAVCERTRLVLLGNPNNPTGSTITHAQLADFMAQLPPQVLVVVDEAYVEYVDHPDYPDSIQMLLEGAPLLILRSFSKAYGLAGLRMGYAIGAPALIEQLNSFCQFYNTNSLAQAAAEAALQDRHHLQQTLTLNRLGLAYLQDSLQQLGLRVTPSQANFLLVEFEFDDADWVIQALAEQGILVKAMSRFGLPHCIRVSTGLDSDNRAFVEALTHIINSRPSGRATTQ